MAVMERNGEKALAPSEARRSTPRSCRSRSSSGRGSIMKLARPQRQQVDFIPTGSIALDLALGVGGIPRGRITEIFGPESSGKTTVCQHVIAEAQKRGRRGGVHRRRARAGSGLRPRVRRQRRRAAREPAGHRRAGARDHRDAHPLRRHRRRRRRLGGGPRAPRGDRGRDGRLVRRHPGPAHEPGAAQADRRREPLEHRRSSSPTSCARRSASCSATRRPRRAAAR